MPVGNVPAVGFCFIYINTYTYAHVCIYMFIFIFVVCVETYTHFHKRLRPSYFVKLKNKQKSNVHNTVQYIQNYWLEHYLAFS